MKKTLLSALFIASICVPSKAQVSYPPPFGKKADTSLLLYKTAKLLNGKARVYDTTVTDNSIILVDYADFESDNVYKSGSLPPSHFFIMKRVPGSYFVILAVRFDKFEVNKSENRYIKYKIINH